MTTGADTNPNHKKTALVEVRWATPFLTVRPAGPQVGQRESPIITDEVNPFLKLAGKTLKMMVLDLSDVTFMSSMGLGMCIAFRNQAAANGAKSVLYGASKDLLQLLAMMKIEKLYTIAKSEDELRTLLNS
ncbi:MAG: STAS domain-containing protein [Phycisphaerae bacterium]|nr:STAS domain-containing protein [Phycisphaerae bacterium]